MKYAEMTDSQLYSEIEFLHYEDARIGRGHAKQVKAALIDTYQIMWSRGFKTLGMLRESLKTTDGAAIGLI